MLFGYFLKACFDSSCHFGPIRDHKSNYKGKKLQPPTRSRLGKDHLQGLDTSHVWPVWQTSPFQPELCAPRSKAHGGHSSRGLNEGTDLDIANIATPKTASND